jgi:hypothetical protein
MSLNENTDQPRRSAPHSATELLLVLRNRYPTDTNKEIIRRFGERVLDDEAIILEVAHAWASLNLNRVTGTARTPAARPVVTAAEREKREKAAEAAITKKIVDVLLLDMLIDGKKLRDMTGAECKRKGGWLTAIGQKVKARQKVGQVLSEVEVKGLCK